MNSNQSCPIFRAPLWILSIAVFSGGTLYSEPNQESSDAPDGRLELVAQIERNVDAGRQLMLTARAQIQSADPATQIDFARIEKAVHAAEARLRRSLKVAESASPANWSTARTSLAASYEAYVHAVDKAERLVMIHPQSAGRRAASR